MERLLAHLGRRELPHFGQAVTWTLLAFSAVLAGTSFRVDQGPRNPAPCTLFSWLPEDWLSRPEPFYVFRGLLAAGIVLWALGWLLPWSCWLTTLAFTGLWSWHVENTYANAHIFNATNLLLVVQSLWCTFHAGEIRAARRAGQFWSTPLYPRWTYLLGLYCLGVFHTYAGLAKLIYSGPEWASGLPLQLWVHLEGFAWSPATWAILGSRSLASALQWLTVVGESAGILGLWPPLRVPVGLLLATFYVGVITTFPYGFEMNLVLVLLYYGRWR